MSIHKHEAIIVTTWGSDVDAIVAFRDSIPADLRQLFVGPIHRTNHFYSFALMPHGSGMGHTVSTDIEGVIIAFVDLLDGLDNAEWACVVLFDETALNNGDDPGPYIRASSKYEFDGEHWKRAECKSNTKL